MDSHSTEPLIQKESGSKRSWKKLFLGAGLCLLLLLVVAWNIVGSQWFLRTVVLPRVNEVINGSITFQSADWSLRRSLVLRGISVEAKGQKPCLKAEELQLGYDLMELLSGAIRLHQVKVVRPEVAVHIDEVGYSNLDPFFDRPQKEPRFATLVSLDNIKVFDGAFKFVRQFANGGEERIAGVNLQVQADRIGNELEGGELNLSTGLQYVLRKTGVPPEILKGTLSLKTGLAFDRQWMPDTVGAVVRAKVFEAGGQFEVVRNLEIDCESVITQNEIKQLDLRFAQQGNPVGALSVSGPWSLAEGTAQLHINMDGLDRRVLNLVGSRWNLDFRSSVINSTNSVVLSHFGKQVEVSGLIRSKPFQLSNGQVSMPELGVLQAGYRARIDLQARRLDVKHLQLIAYHNARKFIEGGIEKPMVLAWGKEEIQAPDSNFKISFTDIYAAEWEPWLGRFVSEGRADLNVDVVSRKAGRQIEFNITGSGDRLKVPVQDTEIYVGEFDLNSSGKLKDFNLLSMGRLNVRLGLLTEPVLQLSWPFELDINNKSVSGHLVSGGKIPILLGWNPKIKTDCKSGSFDYKGKLALDFGGVASQKLDGELNLRNFTGGNGGYSVTNLNTQLVFKASLDKGSTFNIDSLRAEADLNGVVLAEQINAVGKMDFKTDVADLSKLMLKEVDLKLVNQIVPLGVMCQNGIFDYNGILMFGFGESEIKKLDGQLSLRNFTGGHSGYSVTNLSSKVLFKAGLDKGSTLNIDWFRADADLNGVLLAKQINTAGKIDLKTGVADLSELTFKDVDLKLVNQIVPLGSFLEGKVSASLKVNSESGRKTQVDGNATLSAGLVSGWPGKVYVVVPQFEVDLLWNEKGRFKTVINDFNLKVLNHNDRNRQDAFFSGSIEGYDSFTGRLNGTLKQSEVNHALLQSLIAKQIGEAKLISGKITHSDPLKIGLDGKGGVRIGGEVDGEGIKFSDPSGRFPSDVLKAETAFDIDYVTSGGYWKLNESNLTATFELGGGGSGSIGLNGKYQSSSAKGDFNATLNNVDYRIINSLPESWRSGIKLKSGKIESMVTVGGVSKGKGSGRLFVNLKGMDIIEKSGLWPAGPMNIQHNFEGDIGWDDNFSVRVDLNKGFVEQGNKRIVEYDFSGSKQGGDYNFHINNLKVGSEFTRKALAKWMPEGKISAGKIQVYPSELILPKVGSRKFKGKMEFNGFVLETKDTRKTPAALDVELIVDATAKNRVFEINNFTALFPKTEKSVNQAKVSGRLDLRQMRNPSANLKLYSDELDITPLMELLLNKKSGKSDQPDPINNFSGSARFALKQFKVGLDLKRLNWNDLNATNIKGQVVINDRKYNFSPLEMDLMGKPAKVEGFISTTSGSDIQYDLNMTCKNLPLNPIVRHFAPKNKVEWGNLTANCYAKGDALTGETFKQTFIARGQKQGLPAFLEVKGARWGFKEEDPIVALFAGPLALDLPELLDSHFNGAKLEITAGQGKFDFKLGAQGPLLIAATEEKQVELGERFLDSKVDKKIKIEIALQQVLAKKFFKVELKDQGAFWKIPSLLRLSGPIRRPKPSLNQLAIVQLASRRLTGRSINILLAIPGAIIGDSGKNIDEGKIDPFNLLDNPEKRN